MVEFAPVAPIRVYEEMLEQDNEDILGKYHLLLAHDVIDKAARYSEVFKDMYNSMIIMDNSVIELGDAVSAKTLQEAAEIVDASVLVVPDVLQEGDATVKAAEAFLEEWDKLDGFKCDLMFVPQGVDIESYMDCAEQLRDLAGDRLDWWGVARNTTDRIVCSRKLLVGYLGGLVPEASIHLLGFSQNAADDIQTCIDMHNLVDGIDSAVPLRTSEPTIQAFANSGARGNWWEECEYSSLMGNNVLRTRELVNGVE